MEMEKPEQETHVNRMLALVAFSAGIGGFLFGYDTSSISASLLQIRFPSSSPTCPGLTSHWLGSFPLECITSFTTLGAFVAALCAGHLNDLVGRRQVLLIAAGVFAIGAVLMGIAWNLPIMLVARLVAGVGVGLSSHTMPLYVSECCPARVRGMMILTFSIMIVLGQTSAAGFSAIMFYAEVKLGWRWILGVGALPAVLMYAGLLYLPESPRWLLSQGMSADALASLKSLRAGYTESCVEREFQAMQDGINEELSSVAAVPAGESMLTTIYKRYWCRVGVRRALMLGCFLQGLQQLIGINRSITISINNIPQIPQ
jgi:SP family myo-inositol transporter-like MFS transporter 13